MHRTEIDFGTAEKPNLEGISEELSTSLSVYNNYLLKKINCFIHGNPQLQLTPDKPNTARVVLDFLYQREKVGDLYVILFAPGDGTGKESEDYILWGKDEKKILYEKKEGLPDDWVLQKQILVPEEYCVPKRQGIVPRNKQKEKVLLEACFPLGTFEGKYVHPYAISLEQITVDNVNVNDPTRLIKGLQIGRNSASYATLVKDHPQSRVTISSESEEDSLEFPVYLTCGYRRNGQRFGDPHATFYNPKLAEGRPNLMQVAGFLAVEDKDNPLCKVLDEIAIAPE